MAIISTNDYKEVREMLESVPGVREHINRPSLKKGIYVVKKRFELGYSREELVMKLNAKDFDIDLKTLTHIESGLDTIPMDIYYKIIAILDTLPQLDS